jgi:hypothetical protein
MSPSTTFTLPGQCVCHSRNSELTGVLLRCDYLVVCDDDASVC